MMFDSADYSTMPAENETLILYDDLESAAAADDDDMSAMGQSMLNISRILGLLEQLTAEQLDDLYRELGIKHHDDLLRRINLIAGTAGKGVRIQHVYVCLLVCVFVYLSF